MADVYFFGRAAKKKVLEQNFDILQNATQFQNSVDLISSLISSKAKAG